MGWKMDRTPSWWPKWWFPLTPAEMEFGSALSRINLEDMARRAERLNGDKDSQ
ncbi:MAG: hypothetical protein P4L80_14000 [Xanthobacteraceae bacterium]|nr:hypothetical protein [Xanthobacteraceae bacterium]